MFNWLTLFLYVPLLLIALRFYVYKEWKERSTLYLSRIQSSTYVYNMENADLLLRMYIRSGKNNTIKRNILSTYIRSSPYVITIGPWVSRE